MSGQWTLGQLDAGDLGSVVTVTDGGATYTGTLKGAHHSLGLSGKPQTLVILKAKGWQHVKTYPSETPVSVTSPAVNDSP